VYIYPERTERTKEFRRGREEGWRMRDRERNYKARRRKERE
jgi:hypothetical protein